VRILQCFVIFDRFVVDRECESFSIIWIVPFVSVTRLHMASSWRLPQFLWSSLAVARQARRAPGFVGGWLGNDAERGFWTVTVWDSATAMRAFRASGKHLKVMPKLLHWADQASYTHWEQPEATVPSGDAAYERLAGGGTLSKLLKPSARHAAGERVGRTVPRQAQKLIAADTAPS
jgi:hypothetical protein